MDIDMGDVALYVYTLGVVVSGVYLQRTFAGPLEDLFGGSGRFAVLGLGAFVALVWTAYCQYKVVPVLRGEADADVPPTSEP